MLDTLHSLLDSVAIYLFGITDALCRSCKSGEYRRVYFGKFGDNLQPYLIARVVACKVCTVGNRKVEIVLRGIRTIIDFSNPDKPKIIHKSR